MFHRVAYVAHLSRTACQPAIAKTSFTYTRTGSGGEKNGLEVPPRRLLFVRLNYMAMDVVSDRLTA